MLSPHLKIFSLIINYFIREHIYAVIYLKVKGIQIVIIHKKDHYSTKFIKNKELIIIIF
jgi:hypothetical protein